jgi:hypothetical protein
MIPQIVASPPFNGLSWFIMVYPIKIHGFYGFYGLYHVTPPSHSQTWGPPVTASRLVGRLTHQGDACAGPGLEVVVPKDALRAKAAWRQNWRLIPPEKRYPAW